MNQWLIDLLFRPQATAWVQAFFGPGHPEVFRAFTQLGTTWGIVLAVGLGLWFWNRRDAYALVRIVLLQAVITLGVNQALGVPRPDAPGIVKYEHVGIGSFPSGHVLLATVVWGLLYARRRVPFWVAGLAVLAVGLARLYLGVHYLVDVVAGAALGVLLVWAFGRAWSVAEPRLARWPEPAWLGLCLAAVGGVGVAWTLGFFGENSFKWHAGGLVLGGAPALLLERHYVRYTPSADRRARFLRAAVALLVLLPLAWVDRAIGERPYTLGALLILAGAAWAWVLAPALFARVDRVRGSISEGRGRLWHGSRVIAGAVLGIVATLLLYGTAVEPRLQLAVEEWTVPIPHLAPSWVGQEIAVLGDFQVGMWWDNPAMARRALEEVVERRPAAVLLLGDFIYRAGSDPGGELDRVRSILRPLADAGIPAFAVLGNHDWGLEASTAEPDPEKGRGVRRVLEEVGVRVLHNESAALSAPGGSEPLYVVGIGSHYLTGDRPAEALSGVPEGGARVVFMHNPDSFEKIPAGAAPLAAAGHTHGGQIALPFTPDWSWITFAREDRVQADRWAEEGYGAAGNRLYVNRGIGMSVVPVRIGAPPELTVFRLAAAR